MTLLQHCPHLSDLLSQKSPPLTLIAPAVETHLLAMKLSSTLHLRVITLVASSAGNTLISDSHVT